MYKAVAFLEISCGEYRARCGCCTTFRNTPEQVLPRALYDNKVRDLVLERLLDDGMNVEQTLESLRREFLLELSPGFVYDVLRDHARQLDLSVHRRKVLELFRGTLCIDELHLGRFTLLLATDPLADLPVAFALVDANDQDHMRRFLQNLKNWGLAPKVVVTDGSNLYPARLAELWPDADHQLGVFHVIQDINKLVLDAVRRLRSAMARRGKAGRKKKRGRKGAKSQAAAARRGMTVKAKAHFVFRHAQGLPSSQLPPRRAGARRDVPGHTGVGQGAEATGRGAVSQADGIPGQPDEQEGADEQPCGADQPDVPVPGEGTVQVAATADAGAVRGADVGQDLEPTRHTAGEHDRAFTGDSTDRNGRRDQQTTSSRVKTQWC
jgi:transposase-like protein